MWGMNINIRHLSCCSKPLREVPAQKAGGFTLIELLTAMAIIGILALVSAPYYVEYLQRGKISQGIGQLSQLTLQMEKAYLDSHNYGSGGRCQVPNLTDEYFNYSCTTTNNGQNYVWVASSKDGQYSYSVDQDGDRKTLKFKGNTSNASCWLLSSGDCY